MHYLPLFRFWTVKVTSIWALCMRVVYSGIKPAEKVTRLAFSVRQATPCIYLKLPYSLIIKKCLLNKISLKTPIPIVVLLFQAFTCSDNELPLLFQLPTWEPPTFCTVSTGILHNLAKLISF